jgi:IPT/TIG domain
VDFKTAFGICFGATCLQSQSMSGWDQSAGSNVTITSLSIDSGPVGAQVTINGTNFGTTEGSNIVTFNGTPATVVNPVSAFQIIASVPQGATPGEVVVVVNGGVPSNGRFFTVTFGQGNTVPITDIRENVTPNAKVLVLAICGFTDAFKSFWNMNRPGGGHALIYPTYKPGNTFWQIDLGFAPWDVEQILYRMGRGDTVEKALVVANSSAQAQNEQIGWTYDGDKDVKFLPTN